MIDKELLGRAHGALSVAGNGPCVGVLRELVEAIEAQGVPQPGEVEIRVPPYSTPSLYFVASNGAVVNLKAIDVEGLTRFHPDRRIEMRFLQALLEHATKLVAEALACE